MSTGALPTPEKVPSRDAARRELDTAAIEPQAADFVCKVISDERELSTALQDLTQGDRVYIGGQRSGADIPELPLGSLALLGSRSSAEGNERPVYVVPDTLVPQLMSLFMDPGISKVVHFEEDRKSFKKILDLAQDENFGWVSTESLSKELRPDLVVTNIVACCREILDQSDLPTDIPRSFAALTDEFQMIEALHERLEHFEKRLSLDSEWQVEDLMGMAKRAAGDHLRWGRRTQRANEYWLKQVYEQNLKERIRELLTEQREENAKRVDFSGLNGSARLTWKNQSVLDVRLFKERWPEIAESLLKEDATATAIKEALRARGFSPAERDEVYERLSEVSGFGCTRYNVYPAYAKLYSDPKYLGDATPAKPKWNSRYVDTFEQLELLAAELAKTKVFSVDTETWGPEGERLDRDLCLIQIGIPKFKGGEVLPDEGTSVLVDVVALESEFRKRRGELPFDNPLAPLRAALEDSTLTKIIQHRQFEDNQFAKYGIRPDGVIDTEKEARKYRPDMYSYALSAITFEIMGQMLSKEERVSDWHERPLKPDQIEYAELDVEWPVRVYVKMKEFEAATAVDPKMELDDLLGELISTARERLILGREAGFGNDYHLRRLHVKRLERAAGEKLALRGDPSREKVEWNGPEGSASVGPEEQRTLKVDKLREEFPDIAEEVLVWSAKRNAIKEALINEVGLAKSEAEKEVKKLFKVQGFAPNPALTIDPDFEQIYRPDA